MAGLADLFNGKALARAEGKLNAQKLYNQRQTFRQNQGLLDTIMGAPGKPIGDPYIKRASETVPSGPFAGIPQATPGVQYPVEGAPVAGTGLFAQDPQSVEQARARMSLMSPQAFQPAYTGTSLAPYDLNQALQVEMQKGVNDQQLERLKRTYPEYSISTVSDPLGGSHVEVHDKTTGQLISSTPNIETLTEEQLEQMLKKQRARSDKQDPQREAVAEAGTATYLAAGAKDMEAADYARQLHELNALIGDYETGLLTEVGLFTRKLADYIPGINPDMEDTAALEKAQSYVNELVVNRMKPDDTGKRALAGQSSDKELKFFTDMEAKLTTTPSGRRLFAALADYEAQRASEVSQLAQEYMSRSIDEGTLFDPLKFNRYVKDYYQELNKDVPEEFKALRKQAVQELKDTSKTSSRSQDKIVDFKDL